MFEFKPDYEKTKQRMEAFWESELIDRPLVAFAVAKPASEQVDLPVSDHDSARERWLDATFQAEHALARLSNLEFMGDSLPIAYPNLGPEVLSSFYGCPIHFGDHGTSWTDPILDDWADAPALTIDWQSPYLVKLHEMTDALLSVARGRFIVGMTDWHPGGDGVAALRDPAELALDMLFHEDEVKAFMDRMEADYFQLYDQFYGKLRAWGQPITTWLPLISDEKYYVVSNDFSIMISTEMFEEVFLPGLVRECQFLDRSIYHLDGPGALRHLDTILAIDELDALQWVPGAGNEGFERWIDVYQRAQAAGKGVEVFCTVDDISLVMEPLDPHGLYLAVSDVPSREVGMTLLREMERWAARAG